MNGCIIRSVGNIAAIASTVEYYQPTPCLLSGCNARKRGFVFGGAEMAVIRVNKTADYTVMSNTHFKEKEMSLKAKGLLSLMLSLPEGWDYSINGLVTLSKDGKDSVMNSLNELEEFGYLKRTRLINDKGQFSGYQYDIYENPQQGKPCAENPNTGNPQQLNTKQLNTKKSITKEKKERKANSFDAIISEYSKGNEEIKDLLVEWLKVRKAKRAAMTDRAIQMNIDKLDTLAAQSKMSVVEYLKEIICRGWAAFYVINNYGGNDKNNKNVGANGIALSNEKSELDGLF